ncbi:Oxygen-evolving enhancer 3-2, chloroplastic-like protein [Quillaja saponaria]|uniref:Oxygen-evolving enhancer 3-2, chloroplastic-like protein n=1 Tax=Quillaja saponaria TaxID=32244 RepID=A0AAD7KPV5_QUISA|nr:Oxygen-evolving enhancer 3-2, chloroplastic-like protein [Quillaja saponaria]
MSSFTNTITLLHAQIQNKIKSKPCKAPLSLNQSPFSCKQNVTNRRKLVSTFLATSMAVLGVNGNGTPQALAQNWGTRSFLKEHFFEPGLSPEDAVARIKQTAEGLHSIRDMLDTMSWRYVIFYIRLKQAYLSQDMKNAMTTLPEGRRKEYVKTANELVDNMAEFDRYVRSPKVYESYLYYERTLKSIDELVAFLV